MNTPKSVAYGWAALIVATGLGYYYAKGENERRWKDQRARGLRNTDHQDWKEKVAKAEEEMRAEMQTKAAQEKALREENSKNL